MEFVFKRGSGISIMVLVLFIQSDARWLVGTKHCMLGTVASFSFWSIPRCTV